MLLAISCGFAPAIVRWYASVRLFAMMVFSFRVWSRTVRGTVTSGSGCPRRWNTSYSRLLFSCGDAVVIHFSFLCSEFLQPFLSSAHVATHLLRDFFSSCLGFLRK